MILEYGAQFGPIEHFQKTGMIPGDPVAALSVQKQVVIGPAGEGVVQRPQARVLPGVSLLFFLNHAENTEGKRFFVFTGSELRNCPANVAASTSRVRQNAEADAAVRRQDLAPNQIASF